MNHPKEPNLRNQTPGRILEVGTHPSSHLRSRAPTFRSPSPGRVPPPTLPPPSLPSSPERGRGHPKKLQLAQDWDYKVEALKNSSGVSSGKLAQSDLQMGGIPNSSSSGKLAQSDLQMGGIPNSSSELVDYSNRSTNIITALLRSAMKEFTSNKQMFTILNSQTKGIIEAINKGKDDNL
ncbi:uncharacterized protein LOC126584888 isoform X2 [Malus sylvestris]|uniref:uncharacterized protein LOC126584888 isoform X2 n=1 Tax=Malus sylvestris TaxID=3752 RepID=UPI0021ACCADE|nr:uncharacterized protein LOC126584888 isoform X2 [Malus sylvestris]